MASRRSRSARSSASLFDTPRGTGLVLRGEVRRLSLLSVENVSGRFAWSPATATIGLIDCQSYRAVHRSTERLNYRARR